jgi:hypothetical protein
MACRTFLPGGPMRTRLLSFVLAPVVAYLLVASESGTKGQGE